MSGAQQPQTAPKKKPTAIIAAVVALIIAVIIAIASAFLSQNNNPTPQSSKKEYLAFAGYIVQDKDNLEELPTEINSYAISNIVNNDGVNAEYFDKGTEYLQAFIAKYGEGNLNYHVDIEEFKTDARIHLEEDTAEGYSSNEEDLQREADYEDLNDLISNQIAEYYQLAALSSEEVLDGVTISQPAAESEELAQYLGKFAYNSKYSLMIVDAISDKAQLEYELSRCDSADTTCKDNIASQLVVAESNIKQLKLTLATDIADSCYRVLKSGALK